MDRLGTDAAEMLVAVGAVVEDLDIAEDVGSRFGPKRIVACHGNFQNQAFTFQQMPGKESELNLGGIDLYLHSAQPKGASGVVSAVVIASRGAWIGIDLSAWGDVAIAGSVDLGWGGPKTNSVAERKFLTAIKRD